MKLPTQAKGIYRINLNTQSINGITTSQFQMPILRIGNSSPIFRPPSGAVALPPRSCQDCRLLYHACRAAGHSVDYCVDEAVLDCGATCY